MIGLAGDHTQSPTSECLRDYLDKKKRPSWDEGKNLPSLFVSYISMAEAASVTR